MAKNHYVSQLIIRRFSDSTKRINIFDINNKKVLENRRSINMFCKHNIYSDEIEYKLNTNLENPFARLIDSKIIGKDEIRLNRKEVFLIKKFLLLDSIRTLSAEGYEKIFKGFSDTVNRYWEIGQKTNQYLPSFLPRMTDLNESSQASFERALLVYTESNNMKEIIFHDSSTRELYLWSKVFFDSYIGFWDSNDEQEFVLTDNGLTTEYEASHQIYEGLSQSKLAYILSALKNTQINEEKEIYGMLLERISIMFENFSIFNLTSKRSIVILHPFFRLYSEQGFMINFDRKFILPKIPDIWPSFVVDKQSFDIPKTIYKSLERYSDEDEFIYKPHKLTIEDTIYVNYLLLSQSNSIIGFHSLNKIKDSLYAVQAMKALNHKDIYTADEYDNLSKFINHIMDDEFNYIWDYYRDKEDIRVTTNPFHFADRIAQMCINDTRNNIYALEFLLSSEDKFRTMSNFDFMGSPDERVALVKSDIERLKKNDH